MNKLTIFPPQKSKSINFDNTIINNQDGQTLIEFVLLVMMVSLISISFIKLVNFNIGKYWLALVKLVVEDPSVALQLL